MYTTATPSDRRRRMRPNSRSTSSRGRLLVGSSISTTRALRRHRPADLDHLARRNRQVADAAIGMQLRMVERREHARGLGSRGGTVVAAAAARLAAEQDVLGHREVVAEREFLVDQRDAGLARRERTGRRIRRAADGHRAGVGTQPAGQHVHQRALAGAVLPHQRMDAPGTDRERDAIERPGRTEVLPDVGQGQHHGSAWALRPYGLEASAAQTSTSVRPCHGRESLRRQSIEPLLARYSPSGGFSSAFDASVSRLSGVTIVTPVSTRAWMACPFRWATMVFTPW